MLHQAYYTVSSHTDPQSLHLLASVSSSTSGKVWILGAVKLDGCNILHVARWIVWPVTDGDISDSALPPRD
jgi:hypothetical protein